MKNIGVFCSSHKDLLPIYSEAARNLGREIGKHNSTLVYGGSNCGLMEIVAQAVKENGGRVFGVIPTLLRQRGLESDNVDIAFYTENLSDRKDVMLRESDILVALPGGTGTLDEIFTTLAGATLTYHDKKVVLYNINGFWNRLIDMLNEMKDNGFISPEIHKHLCVADTAEELYKQIF